MSEKTMFPREDHADILFQKILNDPWACDRLMETFNENLVYNDEFDVSLPAEKFAKALFNAYTTAIFPHCLCVCATTPYLICCAIHISYRTGSMPTDIKIR
mgnify:CR=1 FL=1